MSLTTRLNSIGLEEKDPALYLLLKSITLAVDRLNVNFSLSYDEPTALLSSTEGAQAVDAAANVAPDVLIVKALRFLGDRHGLNLESAESMGVRVDTLTGQAIPNNTRTAVNFPDVATFDLDDMHDVAANNSRLTIQHAGRYLVGGTIWWEINGVGLRQLSIQKNGGGFDIDVDNSLAAAGIGTFNKCGATLHEFVQGDYVELIAYQNSGGALNLLVGTHYTPLFWAHRIS